jgi:hypothetical protein
MYCPETDRYFYIIVKHNNAYKLKWLSNKVNGTDKNEFRGCLDREKEKMCKLSANNSNNIFHPIILQSPGYVIFFLDEEIYHDPDVDKQIKIENNNTLLSVKELISLNPIALQTVSFR